MSTVYAGLYQANLHLPVGASAVPQRVEVRTTGGSTATIWADKDRTTPLVNPVQVDGAGDLTFYAEPGEYDLVLRGVPTRVAVPVHPQEPPAAYLDAKVGANAVAWDGVTDDTTKLAALAATAVSAKLPLQLPPGTGVVGVWVPPSGLVLLGAGSGQTTIKQAASATGVNDSVINITGTSGVRIEGVTIDGNKTAFGAVVTEHKHGINAQGVTGLTLVDVVVQNCKGDGLYIGLNGAGNHSSNVVAIGCSFLNNYRNNMSIADLAVGVFDACRFEGAGGTSPQDGVDLEPNDNTYALHDITFVGCSMNNNVGRGLAVTMFTGGQVQDRIRVVGCNINGSTYGLSLFNCRGVTVDSSDIVGNSRDGVVFVGGTCQDITIMGGNISGNLQDGVNCTPTAGSSIKNVKVIGTNVRDNGTDTPNTFYGLRFDTVGGAAGSVDGVYLHNVIASGSAQKYGVFTTAAVSNFWMDGCDLRGNSTGAVSLSDETATRQLGANVGTISTGSKIQTFLASGTWNMPLGATKLAVWGCGSGAGAGAGRRGAPGSVRSGGGGGGGGGWSHAVFDAAELPSSVTVTIGAGGAGAAAVTTDNTSGGAGSSGGNCTFGSFLVARGGGGGGAGGTAGATGGTGGIGHSPGSPGGASSSTGGAGTGGAATGSGGGAGGGGGGGGITSADVASAGGAGSVAFVVAGTVGGTAGAVDAATPTSGTASTAPHLPGPGAGGGAASVTAAGQTGANGLQPGGGAGGGGASTNGFNSGGGGTGGAGMIRVMAYFT